MSRQIVGRLGARVICPLCYTIYDVTGDELGDIKRGRGKKKNRVWFYCDICERNVVVNTDDNIQMGYTLLDVEEQV